MRRDDARGDKPATGPVLELPTMGEDHDGSAQGSEASEMEMYPAGTVEAMRARITELEQMANSYRSRCDWLQGWRDGAMEFLRIIRGQGNG